MRQLFWTPQAIQDRDEIYAFIEADKPAAGLALDEFIEEKADRLVNYPLLGRSGRVAGIRDRGVHANYILVYDAPDDLMRVLRVLHTASQWPPERESPE